jgi:16S rRNA (cytosine1402-N4)-methyltransferase
VPEHTPVLLEEALAALEVKAEGFYLDATLGRGGHAGAILMKLGRPGRLFAVDRDPAAVAAAHARFAGDERVTVVHGSFGELPRLLPAGVRERGFDGILFDLGVSSPQLDDPRRGFSFSHDGPLDMRMDSSRGRTAAQWLAEVSERDLADVLRDFGEERFARRVARAIVERRRATPFTRTTDLAEVVAGAVRTREPGKHPATRTFQAIRMAVNDELGQIELGLAASVELLAPAGRLAVISFHSLEDRLTKRFLRQHANVDPVYAGLPHVPAAARPRLRLVGKAVRPGAAEVAANPRARSATLRAAEKVRVAAAPARSTGRRHD